MGTVRVLVNLFPLSNRPSFSLTGHCECLSQQSLSLSLLIDEVRGRWQVACDVIMSMMIVVLCCVGVALGCGDNVEPRH